MWIILGIPLTLVFAYRLIYLYCEFIFSSIAWWNDFNVDRELSSAEHLLGILGGLALFVFIPVGVLITIRAGFKQRRHLYTIYNKSKIKAKVIICCLAKFVGSLIWIPLEMLSCFISDGKQEKSKSENRIAWSYGIVAFMLIAVCIFFIFYILGKMYGIDSIYTTGRMKAYLVSISIVFIRMIIGLSVGEKGKNADAYVYLPLLFGFVYWQIYD